MKVKIPLSKDPYPATQRPELWNPVDDSLLQALRRVRPFVSDDASRLWACSALWKDGYLYATNNIVIVRTPWEWSWAEEGQWFTIPGFTIDQLIRCQKPLTAIHISEKNLTFELDDDVWLDSARYVGKWPEFAQHFDRDWDALPQLAGNEKTIVEKLLPFVPDKRHPVIRFNGSSISTLDGEMEAAVETDCGEGAFHATPLLTVLQYATHMDISVYPKPVPFAGVNDYLEGVVLGVRI